MAWKAETGAEGSAGSDTLERFEMWKVTSSSVASPLSTYTYSTYNVHGACVCVCVCVQEKGR